MLDALFGALAADPLVRGVRIGGSRARGEADEWSDVDLVLDAPGWTPQRLGGLWLGGLTMNLGGSPFFHGVLADGTVLDVILGPPGPGYLPVEAPPQSPPPPVPLAEGPALDFWLNSMKHSKPFGRGVGGMVLFGLQEETKSLLRLWAVEDSGIDPGSGAFTIFGMTPLVRDHLTPERLALLGMPRRDEAELRIVVNAYRDAASLAGRAAETRWGLAYPHLLERVVRDRWSV